MSGLFYNPAGAWAGDFIPFYKQGVYHLFYLHDWRDKDKHGEGTPWYQISTRNFLRFTEHGEMLPRGSKDDQDLYVYTGSAIAASGQYHIFYTGHNPHRRAQGSPEEAVMHAVSDDLLHWHKLPEDTFFAPQPRYEPHDWRDPFVFWNEDAQEYWMLLAARLTTGPSRRRGCTALCTSKDLKTWQVQDPLWAPGLYYTHECPDLFKMGDWWYLVFSEFSEAHVTRYRMSRSVRGPWITPENDTFDGRAYYAAKTASDGERRYLFGWLATRRDNRDDGDWQWGGNLVVHEVVQCPDGSLVVRPPDTVTNAFGLRMPGSLEPGLGPCTIGAECVELDARGTFGCAVGGMMPDACKIQVDLTYSEGTRSCGIMLRVSEDLDDAYYVRVEPQRRRLSFDSWPRRGDLPSMVELERPLDIAAGVPLTITIFIDGSACVVYVAGTYAMSTRLYNLKTGRWGVFASEGAARFQNGTLWTREG